MCPCAFATLSCMDQGMLKGNLQFADPLGNIEQHCPLLHALLPTNSPLMVMPSSTPLLLGSLTWKVPLLGTTDSKWHRKSRFTQEGTNKKKEYKWLWVDIKCTAGYLRHQTQPLLWPYWPERSPWATDELPPKCHLQLRFRWWTAVCLQPAAAHTFTEIQEKIVS